MRRDIRRSMRRERIIMVASSAFVLAALTMTGIYMGKSSIKDRDDGYTMESPAPQNAVEPTKEPRQVADLENINLNISADPATNMENDLDYMPEEIIVPDAAEVDSGLVEIGGEVFDPIVEEIPVQERELNFEGEILRPVEGETVIPYSMDASVYFKTLDQYKYNPAEIISAAEDEAVIACAEGKITDIYDDSELGSVVVMELGGGFEATYGQLGNIQVAVGEYVNAGQQIATVEMPTKYFSVEGSNLYFKLTENGTAVNPEDFF